MNPFRKRSKSQGDIKKNRNNKLPGNPQIISSVDVAFSLPSENAFRTSLLMPKMADRFSLLRVDEQGQYPQLPYPPDVDGPSAGNGFHPHHNRDLSILEEGDEEDEELPVRPWNRHDGGNGGKGGLRGLRNGMSKDEFIRVRAQEGNSNMFSGKQRTFKIKSEDGNDTDRGFSSSSLSSKSPHSPAFEYRPSSSHTSATSSIIFSSNKPPPINTKVSNPLGFDFGLSDPPANNQAPPSPTSTVYEVIDSPTVPDFLLAEDGSTTVNLVRNHLRSPSESQSTPNLRDARFGGGYEGHKLSAEYARNYTSNEYDRDSLFGDDSSGVLGYYGQDDREDERESTIKLPQMSDSKAGKRTSPMHTRQSLFDDLAPSKPSLNVTTNVTIVRSPSPATPAKSPLRSRQSEVSNFNFSSQRSPTTAVHPIDASYIPNGGVNGYGHGYDAPPKSPITITSASIIDEDDRRDTKISKRSRSGSVSTRSRSNSEVRRITPITTDIRYITPEMPSTAIFPNTPPPSVSPNSTIHPTHPVPQSLTPPPTISERTPPSENVIKALKDKNISEPHFISMTTSVPTIPIIKMDDNKLTALRNERRKVTNRSFRTPRKPMFDDEVDDIGAGGVSRAVSPNPFTRRKTSPPGIATRRRETTAGSVLFAEDERRDELLAGPEYTTQLPSPFQMEDTPYVGKTMTETPKTGKNIADVSKMGKTEANGARHRRKVSRTECDPVNTMSSPAVLSSTWDMHPKNDRRRMEGAIDPAW